MTENIDNCIFLDVIQKIKNNSKSLKKGNMEMYVNHQWYSLKQIKNNNKISKTFNIFSPLFSLADSLY